MSKEVDNILNKIDNLQIYKRDFDVISDILQKSDPKLFSVILEAVLNGDLYWSDFERILHSTDYNKYVLENLESQQAISKQISRLIDLRRKIFPEIVWRNAIALGNDIDNTDLENKMYELESKNMRDNILYELSKVNENDNELSILCKLRLYNYIMNYTNSDSEDLEEYSINPDDIFLFINDLLIPIDDKYQILDSTDLAFMKENNLTEAQMKKYKAVSFFLRKFNLKLSGGYNG